MLIAFFSGLTLGFSLIVAIGAQNAFVLRQGLLGKHVFSVALFCSLSDGLLIFVGISGAMKFFTDFVQEYSRWLFVGAAIWLLVYSVLRFIDAYKSHIINPLITDKSTGIWTTLTSAAVLTFANPHVYLDTVVLLGTISMKFESSTRLIFGLGATVSSFLFFFSLAYGAKFIAPRAESPMFWKFVNIGIGFIMLIIAFWMFKEKKIL